MTRFGVPGDDMPDNLPPPGWGPESFDERDLDAVLAGKTADLPDPLLPVADLLAALRVGPAPAELYGEANAMAEFRALGLGQAEHLGGPAPTLLLNALPAEGRGGRPGRPRARHRRRRALRRTAMRPAALLGAVAAAVIALAVLVTGNFAGPFREIAHMARPSAGSPSATGSTRHSTAPGVETSSSALYTTTPPSATYSPPPPPSPSEACRNFYSYIEHPQGPSPWATQLSLWHQLTNLVGSDNWGKVSQYCAPYVKDLYPGEIPAAGQNQPSVHPEPGNQNIGQQTGDPANSRSSSSSDQVNSSQDNSQGTPAAPAP